MTDGFPPRPLSGVVVLDLVRGQLAPTSRIWADLGAKVVRCASAFSGGVERDRIAREIGNLGKVHGVEDDTPSELASAHLVIHDNVDDRLAKAIASERARRPGLVTLRVSMFGADGPFAAWEATDPVLQALTGSLARSGLKGRAPLLPSGQIALEGAMAQAATAGLAALYRALSTGHGEALDFAALDGAMQALDPGYGPAGSATAGQASDPSASGRPVRGRRYPIFRCLDGYVRICVLSPRQWAALFQWMGEPPAFADPRFRQMGVRFASRELTAALETFFADRASESLEREGQAYGVPIAALRSFEACLDSDHVRPTLVDIELSEGLRGRILDGVIEIDGRRMGPAASAPSQAPFALQDPPSGPPRLPLQGVTVLDLGVIVVGAEQGRLLADLGADVVKVESLEFPDGSRQSQAGTGLSVSFAAGHRNKRSLGLNLRDPRGLAIFRALAARADIVLSNFKPGTTAALGISHADLAKINPALISVESSAFGSAGPWAGRMGYGPLVRAAAGVTSVWRYPDHPESFSDSVTVYPDHVAARIGVIAVLALLIRRLRTGRGGEATISQLDVMLDQFAADSVLAANSGGERTDAPWGVFQAAGDDEWCVVTVRDDEDWRRLAPFLGLEGRYATRTDRSAARQVLDEAVGSWMRTRSADAAMHELQAIGVPGARMLRVPELPEHELFASRGAFRSEQHPRLDQPMIAQAFVFKGQQTPPPDTRPAPLMGEHTREVMETWLGMAGSDVDELVAAGVLQPTPQEILDLFHERAGA